MGVNKDEAQCRRILGLMPLIPAAFVISRVDRMSCTSMVDISMSCKG